MMHRHLAALRAVTAAMMCAGALLAWSGDARADIPPPNSSQCRSSNLGDGCKTDDGKSGTCASAKCSHRTVSPDGGFAFEQYDCLQCASTEGAKPASSNGAAPASTGSAAPSAGKSGCSVVRSVGLGESGLSFGLLGVAVALGFRRSRRAK